MGDYDPKDWKDAGRLQYMPYDNSRAPANIRDASELSVTFAESVQLPENFVLSIPKQVKRRGGKDIVLTEAMELSLIYNPATGRYEMDPKVYSGEDRKPISTVGILLSQNLIDEALALAEVGVAENPDSIEALVDLYSVYVRKGDDEKGLSIADKILAIDPSLGHYHQYRSRHLAALGRFDEAVEAIDNRIAIEPNWLNVYVLKGQYLKAAGRELEALEAYEQGLTAQSDREWADVHRQWMCDDLNCNSVEEALEYIKAERERLGAPDALPETTLKS